MTQATIKRRFSQMPAKGLSQEHQETIRGYFTTIKNTLNSSKTLAKNSRFTGRKIYFEKLERAEGLRKACEMLIITNDHLFFPEDIMHLQNELFESSGNTGKISNAMVTAYKLEKFINAAEKYSAKLQAQEDLKKFSEMKTDGDRLTRDISFQNGIKNIFNAIEKSVGACIISEDKLFKDEEEKNTYIEKALKVYALNTKISTLITEGNAPFYPLKLNALHQTLTTNIMDGDRKTNIDTLSSKNLDDFLKQGEPFAQTLKKGFRKSLTDRQLNQKIVRQKMSKLKNYLKPHFETMEAKTYPRKYGRYKTVLTNAYDNADYACNLLEKDKPLEHSTLILFEEGVREIIIPLKETKIVTKKSIQAFNTKMDNVLELVF